MPIAKDNSLKTLFLNLIDKLGFDHPAFINHVKEYYKDDVKKGREYLKKIRGRISWKTFLQTLQILGCEDYEVHMQVTHRLPISKTEYAEPVTIYQSITRFDSTINLDSSELSRLLTNILEQSNIRQPIYINRIIDWLMTQEDGQIDTTTLRIRASGFIKKVSGDNITWATFTDAIRALGSSEVKFGITIKKPDETIFVEVDIT